MTVLIFLELTKDSKNQIKKKRSFNYAESDRKSENTYGDYELSVNRQSLFVSVRSAEQKIGFDFCFN